MIRSCTVPTGAWLAVVPRCAAEQSRLLLLAQSIALALDHQRVTVVQEAIEDRRGQHVVTEHRAPLGDDLIGRDSEAAPLVAPRDQLEKEMRAAPLEG